MKRVVIGTLISAISMAGLVTGLVISSAPANAAIKCTQTTIKPFTPGKVAQPTKPAASLPKRFTFNTNCGVIEVTLNSKAPLTITSLAALIRGKYYDNSFCHRLTTDGLFVLQCGDPTFTGGGSPTGWKGYKEENLPKNVSNNYPAGTVAMANAGAGTNGSQMFFVYKDTTLPPNYTIFGKITKGLDVINYIAKQGAVKQAQDGKWYYQPDGYPIQNVRINSAKVS